MSFCRDCLSDAPDSATRCATCRSPRLARHPELHSLTIAHIDCDAFYATIEKRDNPDIADKPVVVGGGTRGVVAAACYIARTYGIRSAMPMFEARRRCPDAIVIKPNMGKYVQVGREVRKAMFALTPLVEPLSIDEAFLDLSGTERLHGKSASDLDKPRGFAVLGTAEAVSFLANRPVGFIYGVGAVSAAKLAADGFRTIADLQRADEHDLMRRYGEEGLRLWRLARGIDGRSVNPERDTKSISAETTFNHDISEFRPLEQYLWELTERVSARLKASSLAGSTVTLKLKSVDFKIRTRARALGAPTQLASRIFAAGRDLLTHEVGATRFRLIGIGVSNLEDAIGDDLADLIDRR